ncbi:MULTISPECIES: hypothetical protein [Sciscionella]|uniref:hypothetical protein n=1 Tax=Sciscionella TaxID=596495 RepID=UPI0003768BAA|nr:MULTISPECIES: hypothetical protein [Sciscionella]
MKGNGHNGGRHRLGEPGLVHCVRHHEVAEALAEFRRSWFTAILVPAKHSLAGLRKRAARAAIENAWAPTRAQAAG